MDLGWWQLLAQSQSPEHHEPFSVLVYLTTLEAASCVSSVGFTMHNRAGQRATLRSRQRATLRSRQCAIVPPRPPWQTSPHPRPRCRACQ